MPDARRIGEFIRVQRESANLTQQSLAHILNVQPQTISKWERGIGIPDVDSLMTLSHFFRVSIDDLLNGNFQDGKATLNEQIAILDSVEMLKAKLPNHRHIDYKGRDLLDYATKTHSIHIVKYLIEIDPGFVKNHARYEEVLTLLNDKEAFDVLRHIQQIQHTTEMTYCPYCGRLLKGNVNMCPHCSKDIKLSVSETFFPSKLALRWAGMMLLAFFIVFTLDLNGDKTLTKGLYQDTYEKDVIQFIEESHKTIDYYYEAVQARHNIWGLLERGDTPNPEETSITIVRYTYPESTIQEHIKDLEKIYQRILKSNAYHKNKESIEWSIRRAYTDVMILSDMIVSMAFELDDYGRVGDYLHDKAELSILRIEVLFDVD